MKHLSKLILIFLFWIVSSFAQAPDTAWTRTYRGDKSDYGKSVQQTSDGGYIIAGCTYPSVEVRYDVYLIKTNPLGDTLWTRTYGGANLDYGESVQQSTDGGYIIAGRTHSYGEGNCDVYLIKTNSIGDSLWTKTYGGTYWDYGESVQQSADGGYVIAGATDSYGAGGTDVYLIKTNSLGDTLWTRTYGGIDWDYGRSVRQSADGGYIIAGETYSYGAGESDVYLIKTDSIGDTLWTRTYGGDSYDKGTSVEQTSDGGYIIAGSYYTDIHLIKTDSIGDTLWTRTYEPDDYIGGSVQQTSDGGYIFGGYTAAFPAGVRWSPNTYIIKVDSEGDTLWTKNCVGIDGNWDRSIQQTTDGGYIFAGNTYFYTAPGVDSIDVYLMKIKPKEDWIEEKIAASLLSLSSVDPNPFTAKTTIYYELGKAVNVDIFVYNMLGQRVRHLYSGRKSSGAHSVTWNGIGDSGEKLASGVYLLKIEAEGKGGLTKVLLVR